ncbi:MAG TPA: zf-HC2 domain-containing protein [Ktedonobacterales bacterium]
MGRHSAAPRPSPQPLCSVYSPLLPLLRSSELTLEERSAVEAHLEDCGWCRNQVATYDAVDDALRSHYQFPQEPPTAATPRMLPQLTLEDVEAEVEAELDNDLVPDQPLWRGALPSGGGITGPQLRTTLAAVAATLLIAILAASLFSAFGSRAPAAAPTPGLDAQSWAYLEMLETYYIPVGLDNNAVGRCDFAYGFDSQNAEMPWMQRCQPVQATFAADAHAFSNHLSMPPPRWQTADDAFKQALREVMPLTGQGIAAQSPYDLYSVGVQENTVMLHLCPSVTQINQDLQAAHLPLSSLLPAVEYGPGDCTNEMVG